MIYGFTRQSGGQVQMQPRLGSGTEACIYLPCHHSAAEAIEIIAELPLLSITRAEETMLVVDDGPSVRMLVVEVLNELGYAALQAGDAVAGWRLLESDVRIDLLVSDVGLPGGIMADKGHHHLRTDRCLTRCAGLGCWQRCIC